MISTLTRRGALGAGMGLGLTAATAALTAEPGVTEGAPESVERWGVLEITLTGPHVANPFTDVSISAVFAHGERRIEAPGFYDGDGLWRVRFSPDQEGDWTWATRSDAAELDGRAGAFHVTPPGAGNHGPVGVIDTFHFAHADGTPYRQLGTTAYGWTHQSEARRRLTLETLAASPFNKIRMLVFPNSHIPNEPVFPFEKAGPGAAVWDLTRFNPAFFQRLDRQVAALMTLGVQADVILFHPYDDGAWNFDRLPAEADDRYVRYVVARLAAYRNVWWSVANEFDILEDKTDADWDRLFQVVRDSDPHARLRSIHNWRRIYDNGKPWVTHASIQNGSAVLDDARAVIYRDVWYKPVVFDEVRYEGTMEDRWGNLTGQEMTRAFWEGLIAGTYVGHSETTPNSEEGFWLVVGGTLVGESPPRLAFFRRVMDEAPAPGYEPIDKWWEQHLGGKAGQLYLRYFGEDAPTQWEVNLPRDELEGGERFEVDVIDTWNMTIDTLPGVFAMARKDRYFFHDPARPTVSLPGRPWMAVRVRRV